MTMFPDAARQRKAGRPVGRQHSARKPEFSRRILLCVTGLTPQVVTESIYALAHRDPPFHPTEVHIVTTAQGRSRVELELLDPRIDHLAQLCLQYKLPLPRCDASTVHVIRCNGGPAGDLRTAEENDAAADTILEVLRALTADPQSQIHLSIAGGRKTMGFYLGYCGSLLGRPQDEMSHVLVNAPFENLASFYFPPSPPGIVYGRDNKPYDTAKSRVELAPVAFLRLRQELPAGLIDSPRSFSETVRLFSALQGEPQLTLRILTPDRENAPAPGRVIVSKSYEVELSPKSFAVLWMFARLATAPRGGRLIVEEGSWGQTYRRLVLPAYGAVTGKNDRWAHYRQLMAGRVNDNHLRSDVYRLNQELEELLGLSAKRIYGVSALGPKGRKRYGLSLSASAIELEDLASLADRP